MRTNNSNVKNTIVSIYFVLIVFAMVMATVFKTFSGVSENSTVKFLIIAFGFVVLFFFVHFISKFFEYDSDGIKVVILNKGLLFSDQFNYREHRLEFEKKELYAYKFKNYLIYKTLTIYLINSRDKRTKDTFNVTLVGKRKRRYIRQSLNKMVKSNKNSND